MSRGAIMVLAAAALLAPLRAAADEGGSFTMPLPSPDLPDGVLTVKVVGSGMDDLKVGQPVMLLRAGDEGGKPAVVQTAKTGDDARARFEKLAPGVRYVIKVELEGKTFESAPLTAPEKGGLRLLLSLGGGPAMPGMPGGAGQGALPPGHPPASQPGLPAGHPPTGTGAAGPGQSGAARTAPAPELEPGQLLIKVVKGMPPRPVAGAMVFVPGAAKGSHPRTDSEGKLLVTLAATQAKAAPSITVVHDDMSYRSDALKLPDKGGLAVTFTVYDRSRDLSALSIAPGSQLILHPSEEALTVMEMLQIDNRSQALVDADAAGLVLELPPRARGIEVPDDQKDILAIDTERGRVRFSTPLPPGPTVVRLFFELPYKGAALDFTQRLPLAAPELVAALRGPGKLSGPSIKGPAGDGRDGVTLAAVPAGGQVELSLDGLPHRDRRAAVMSLGLAALLLLWGVLAAVVGPRHAKKREEQREALLQQLVQLQRSKHRGEETAMRRRQLLAELGAIWDEHEPEAENR